MRALLALVAVAFAPAGKAAVVTWDGGGGDYSWQNPLNWSGDALPGTNDQVVINVAGAVTINSSANVTIASLQCSNSFSLSAGLFRMTAFSSIVQGSFSATGTPTLSVTGSGTSFNVVGSASADGAAFEATGGATLTLPGLTTYTKGSGCSAITWLANGSGSVIDFPALTVLTGATCATLTVQAQNGGRLAMTNLTTLADGVIVFLADGTNSVISLPALLQSLATTRVVTFEARNTGAIEAPVFLGGKTVSITLNAASPFPVAQLVELGGFTANAISVNFPLLTNLVGGNVTVRTGAVVTLPGLATHFPIPGCMVHNWTVSGAGSVLDLSNLTGLAGPTCGNLDIRAVDGGLVVLDNLFSVSEGTLNFLADGTNSMVDLIGLEDSQASARTVTFEARNTGRMWMPLLSGGPAVRVTLSSAGVLPVAQLRRLNGFTITGMAVNFSSLTNLGLGNITANGGAVVLATNVLVHDESTGCPQNTWLVSGAGSTLNVSRLTSLTGATCGYLTLQATAGGLLVLSNLPSINEGTLYFIADGADSWVDLRSLQSSSASARTISFEARNNGTMWMPLLPGGPMVRVTLASNGILPVAQLTSLNGFNITGMTVDFPSLTTLGLGNITVNGGAVVTASSVLSHNESTGCPQNTWLVTDAGSVLNFPSLATLTGATCGYLDLKAMSGGTLHMGGLGTLNDGVLYYEADGTNSLVDLSALQQSLAASRLVSFEARNAGIISMPLLQGGPSVAISIKSGGTLDAVQMNLLKSLTVSGTGLILPGITNLFAGNLTVDQGAVVSLPNLFSHDHGVTCTVNSWSVSDAGSVLDLSSLTNLSGTGCGSLIIQALAGGTAILSNLPAITDGWLSFLADGTNSRIDLAKLRESLASSRNVAFEVRNAGNIAMPVMTGGSTVSVTIRSNGIMPVAQMGRLKDIVVAGATGNFNSLTNFDAGSITLSNAAVVSAPSVGSYARGTLCAATPWVANGAGSVLSLTGLGLLMGGTCGWLDAVATNGGKIYLSGLTNIPSGTVYLRSASAGSLMDLGSLVNFLNPQKLSRLVATNGGTFNFNADPFLLSGVTINIATETPGLSPMSLAPTNLVLHGNAWHSYGVEQRDSSSPVNPWGFLKYVPLTNYFQAIDSAAAANQEFRAWEYLADPAALSLTRADEQNLNLVLYSSNNLTYEVLTTTNLSPPVFWETLDTVAMTNTFRILPPQSLSIPERFYRLNEL